MPKSSPPRFTEERAGYRWLVCQRCNACCQWPGFVRLSDDETDRLAHYLGLEPAQFLERYTELLPSRSGITLRSDSNHVCILFSEGGCLVQPVKPDQCRAFPNGWSFPEGRALCRAIPAGG